jgi:DNA excision repair protein ERCC-1
VTAPRSINKSDAASLISTFGSLQAAINAQPEQVTSIPGWGEKKVDRWCKAVREDFRVEIAKKRPAANQERRIEASRDGRDLQSLINVDKYRRNPIEGDEDEAMLLALAQEGSRFEGETTTESRPARSRDLDSSDGVNEGIMAALENFREQGDKT